MEHLLNGEKAPQYTVDQLEGLDDHVLLKVLRENFGEIALPEGSETSGRFACAIVMAAGPGTTAKDGTFVPMQVGVGDYVILPYSHMGEKLTIDGEDYATVRESRICYRIKKEKGNRLWWGQTPHNNLATESGVATG